MEGPTDCFDNGQVTVTKILVHPIKSCRGTSVQESRYTPQGLENDRKWAIMDANKNVILTAREVPQLVMIHPRIQYDASSPTKGQLVISVPSEMGPVSFSVPLEPTSDILASWPIIEECSLFGVYRMDAYICRSASPSGPSPSDVLSEFLGKDVHLIMKGPTPRMCPPTLAFPDLKAKFVFQDGYPLLVASEESLDAVASAICQAAQIAPDQPGRIGGMNRERWSDEKVPIERFRPNIVVKGAGVPFAEDTWQRITIHAGANRDVDESRTITLVSRCARCLLPNVDPSTGIRDAAVPYKVIMKFRTGVDPSNANKPCFGSNGVPGGNGVVRVGDHIAIRGWVQPGH
ncbi:hypothetical protein PHLGIDRAFT_66205 [Phlebiopsis gigantea 11061_1 CR5-6]|uniref:MOSC domain-containing protein n=1 Tax=Phlebiopsis gigantea (strain 11061_1 CR5-6) TaxID=745531 RepID=A0A0C3NXL1_PHLG1|nr:hypothetical protein PHLGIDRAFT_66205 [Phlebiopsis gigantea 11061_1 CR5-6]